MSRVIVHPPTTVTLEPGSASLSYKEYHAELRYYNEEGVASVGYVYLAGGWQGSGLTGITPDIQELAQEAFEDLCAAEYIPAQYRLTEYPPEAPSFDTRIFKSQWISAEIREYNKSYTVTEDV